jgi:hypothetical protein
MGFQILPAGGSHHNPKGLLPFGIRFVTYFSMYTLTFVYIDIVYTVTFSVKNL